jgi:hypothetical protein
LRCPQAIRLRQAEASSLPVAMVQALAVTCNSEAATLPMGLLASLSSQQARAARVRVPRCLSRQAKWSVMVATSALQLGLALVEGQRSFLAGKVPR